MAGTTGASLPAQRFLSQWPVEAVALCTLQTQTALPQTTGLAVSGIDRYALVL